MHLKLRGRTVWVIGHCSALNPRFSRQLWNASTSRWRKGIFASTQSEVMLELREGGIMSSQEMGAWLWKQLMLGNLLFHGMWCSVLGISSSAMGSKSAPSLGQQP